MTLHLLDLPSDVLRSVIAIVGSPGLVVACPDRALRSALRESADSFERARFGGDPGLTVREAEAALLARSVWPDGFEELSVAGRA